MSHSSAGTLPIAWASAPLSAEVWVLANWSGKRLFVRWYASEEQAIALFDAAIVLGGENEQVAAFRLEVPNVVDPVDVRERAEAAVRSGQFAALRSYVRSK